ncbi:MAG TPA: aminomethyl-transferring glycine dehydrogenase subunit GcvPA [Deltaproteobacteria bacterium]|nr:aminomethyl-transferring glycine dehydrogenase subunit GcvPA [Deltaproteobacteria bacterium]
MPFLALSPQERESILSFLGIRSEEELFSCIPEELRYAGSLSLEGPYDEQTLRARFPLPREAVLFTGGGVYRHYVPALVDAVAHRQEFVTSYTPYQPEISQGTLQAIFEYQSMMASLTGMEAANASLYDGATALAEAALMSLRIKGVRRILISRATNPTYRAVVRTYLQQVGDVEVHEIPFNPATGSMDISSLKSSLGSDAAFFFQNPNYFGVIEPIEEISRMSTGFALWGVVINDAVSLGVLSPPGTYGSTLVIGEAQSFGNPVCGGGPLLGFFCTTRDHIRKMPGRIVGLTHDHNGKQAFCLTLSTREQHIRREKATSNICTNQGLCALRAALYLSAMGPIGLRKVASQCASGARYLRKLLSAKGMETVFSWPFFHEFVVRMDEKTFERLEQEGIVPGIRIESFYPEISDGVLVTVTEMNTKEDCRCLLTRL